jgi:hypothetical protein
MSECLIAGFHNTAGAVTLCIPDTDIPWDRNCAEWLPTEAAV